MEGKLEPAPGEMSHQDPSEHVHTGSEYSSTATHRLHPASTHFSSPSGGLQVVCVVADFDQGSFSSTVPLLSSSFLALTHLLRLTLAMLGCSVPPVLTLRSSDLRRAASTLVTRGFFTGMPLVSCGNGPAVADISETLWSSAVQICPISLPTVLRSHQQAGSCVFVPAEGGLS